MADDPLMIPTSDIDARAAKVRLVLTDVDGVLTDGGVFYGSEGEVMKRFNIRDGMGVERLRAIGVEVGIITGEKSESVVRRAEKLNIELVHLFSKDKKATLDEILGQKKYDVEEIAYIGDDVNDLDIMKLVGFPACPADAFHEVKEAAKYVCRRPGGHGAFRELCEVIIEAKKAAESDAKKSFGFG